MVERGPALQALVELRDDMRRKGATITVFPFSYKRQPYFVIVQRYLPEMLRPQYAVAQLQIVAADNFDLSLISPASKYRLLCTAQELREFFSIEYATNLRDLLGQFSQQLGRAVPTTMPGNLEEAQRLVAGWYSDPKDPAKVYLSGIRRNPETPDGARGQRSSFNTQKTIVLRPTLFRALGEDLSISFCYSADQAKERTDQAVLADFSGR